MDLTSNRSFDSTNSIHAEATVASSFNSMPPSESNLYQQNLEMEPIFAQALNSIPSNAGNPTEKGAPVIWINGYPGTGKLTVATAVLGLLGTGRALLVDTHQLIDQVKLSRRNPRYWDARKAERQLVFEKYVLSKSQKDKIVMFTDFQTDTNNGVDTSIEYLQQHSRPTVPFCPSRSPARRTRTYAERRIPLDASSLRVGS
ncbi:Ribose 5-phosphate isomerase A [Colletotrichum higginsianum IMI 349063]|uniref:Ribose 5-phosphate isomerase A n=1 Tax=Colletotrichum higginsianum (strain IMI 349063) TaxID=759273 RepID=A0A1B7YLQ2_COLHI|nr:Ribose 5-phosphate isomerase A [Colletotrichum higginsianum IMI 349063]OBR12828.1 Ribose 5-phosphate isomerase A [Colletotrichum higginsianum IMI 349063]